MKTYAPRQRDIERRWYVVDADGAVLGRLASEVAKILRGKHKPIFAPHADTGDHVIVVNAAGIRLTGGKETEKTYWRHSGYPGGITGVRYDRLLAERPALAVERAVRGMLPKNRLGRKMIGKLAVYSGAEHPHAAQKPVPLALGEVPPWEGLPPRVTAPRAEPEPAPERRPASGRPPSARTGGPAKAKTERPKAKATATAAKAPSAKAAARASRAPRKKKES